jgi:hypothetical protein
MLSALGPPYWPISHRLEFGNLTLSALERPVTLIYGCAIKDIGFLVGDTLLTPGFKLKGAPPGPISGKFHALKIQILDTDTAIAFAGDVETSLDLIKKIHEELCGDPKLPVPERLFKLYKDIRPPPDCEFLVLKLTSEGKKLAHVTIDCVRYCERAHIGDLAEYKQMIDLREPYKAPKEQHVQQADGTFLAVPLEVSSGEAEFEEIAAAMEKLTNKRRSETVESRVGAICGLVTRVVDAKLSGKLEYLQSGESSVKPEEEGNSGYSFLASNSGARGVGVYWPSGKMGFIFKVGDSEPCRKEQTETMTDFIKNAKEKYGMNLDLRLKARHTAPTSIGYR